MAAAVALRTVFANTARNPFAYNVGYGHFQVPSGYSIWTPTFKDVDSTKKIDLLDITPCKDDCSVIDVDSKIYIFKLNTDNTWSDIWIWYGKQGGWSKDNGSTILTERGVVVFEVGEGFALQNTLTEGSGRTAKNVPARFKISGEVDLVCQNTCPSGYSINGNSSPVARDLLDFTPYKTDGSIVDVDSKVYVFKVNTDNTWSDIWIWYGKQGGWSKDNGSTILTERGVVTFAPGEGFAMQNTLTEGSGRTAKNVPVVLHYTKPIAD